MLSLLLTLSLAAAPGGELRVAAPALGYSNLDPRTGDFFLDALGQQLIKQGIKVTSQKEIAAVLGLERQKQLLGTGTGNDSVMELGGAFGADAIITGSLAKTTSGGFALNLNVVHSSTAETIVAETVRTKSDDELLDWFEGAAVRIAKALRGAFARDAGVDPRPQLEKPADPIVTIAEARWDAGSRKRTAQSGYEVLWNGSWYEAEVLDRRADGKAFIHYVGYGDSWDEWVAPARLRDAKAAETQPASSSSANRIEVEWNGTWYPATVLETKKNGDAFIHYDGYSDSWNEWVPPSRQRPIKGGK